MATCHALLPYGISVPRFHEADQPTGKRWGRFPRFMFQVSHSCHCIQSCPTARRVLLREPGLGETPDSHSGSWTMADTTNKAVWQCSVAIGGVMELLEAKGAEMVDRDLIPYVRKGGGGSGVG